MLYLERIVYEEKEKNSWPLIVTILAFGISLLFSFISESIMPKVGIIIGIIILIAFILIGIIFDMIGVAVTSSDEEPLHAMSSKRLKVLRKLYLLRRMLIEYLLSATTLLEIYVELFQGLLVLV